MDLTKALHYRKAIRHEANRPNPRAGLVRPMIAILLGTALCLSGTSTASAPALTLSAKEFAKYKLQNKVQFRCLIKLYSKESAWNPKAVNGPHYGIPQGRSIYLKTASPIDQVRWGIRYIENRYHTPCKAYKHFTRYNWH